MTRCHSFRFFSVFISAFLLEFQSFFKALFVSFFQCLIPSFIKSPFHFLFQSLGSPFISLFVFFLSIMYLFFLLLFYPFLLVNIELQPPASEVLQTRSRCQKTSIVVLGFSPNYSCNQDCGFCYLPGGVDSWCVPWHLVDDNEMVPVDDARSA